MSNSFEENFKSFFIPKNNKMTFAINDNLDVVVMVSSKLEQDLYDQMTKTFNSEDLHVMRQLYRLEKNQEMERENSKLSKYGKKVVEYEFTSKQKKLLAKIS